MLTVMIILPLLGMNVKKINDKTLTKIVCDENHYGYA